MYKILLLLVLIPTFSKSADTLFTHPIYPPIVYVGQEFNFYKYTPKYAPDNMLHCFKILATADITIVERFKLRSEEEVIERGMFEHGYRIRKEFCLEGFSSFSQYFHTRGIYYPYSMKTDILLAFHQYLNQQEIDWKGNKNKAIQNWERDNRLWKKRANRANKMAKKRDRKATYKVAKYKEVDPFFLN